MYYYSGIRLKLIFLQFFFIFSSFPLNMTYYIIFYEIGCVWGIYSVTHIFLRIAATTENNGFIISCGKQIGRREFFDLFTAR